jgi:aerobic carbon-monoxide dehydrogenase medium subunit
VQLPAPFEYERASSVDDAISRLQRLGPEARLIAGGHSLLPMMKLRLAAPEFLVDINDLRELDYIEADADELRIGAMTRHRELLESDAVALRAPIFRDAERLIADPVVRNRGTIGGALCQADPAEDLWAVCAVLKAQVALRGPAGGRVTSMPDFHRGPYETALEDGEVLVEVRLPLRTGHGSAYEKVKRRAGDWAIAAAGAALWLRDGEIVDAGVALAAVGAPVASAAAEQALIGSPPSAELFDRAAALAAEECSPADDQRGPADYKRHLAGELTRRALRRADDRARGLEV